MEKTNRKRNGGTVKLIISLCTVIFFVSDCRAKRPAQSSTENNVVFYQTEYYKIEVLSGWKIESRDGEAIFSKEEKILSIEVSDGNYYCSSIEQIIHTYLGMHARVKGELKEREENGWQKAEAVITWEQPPGLAGQGVEKEPDQWRCIYTDSKEIIVDISMDHKWIGDQEIENLLQSFQISGLDKIY